MPFNPPRRDRRPYPPSRRQSASGFSRNRSQQAPSLGLSGHVKSIMGHVGKVRNGINMMRQIGSILKFFR